MHAAPTNTEGSGGGEMSFAELFQQSLKEDKFREGEVVRGTVMKITGEQVIVDIGYKSEGTISVDEFREAKGEISVKAGDEIDVMIESTENELGTVVLSKHKADMKRAWHSIAQASKQDQVVEGTIVARVKGGLSVDIGVKAFLPGSQVDLRPVKNLDAMIGQRFKFKIIKFNEKRGNIVLSRRALLEKERETLKKETISNLEEGKIVDGIVKNITDYGAFIDLGGLDGLLHITDTSVDGVAVSFDTSGALGFTAAEPVETPSPIAHGGWSVPRTIQFWISQPKLRTDEPHELRFPEFEIFRVPIQNTFFFTATHEARHVWQQQLLVRTGADFCNNERADCNPALVPNQNPDNNDDFLFYDANGDPILEPFGEDLLYDCLPERALLSDGTDIGGGSARSLIDSETNPEFPDEFAGETPGGEIESQQADHCRGLTPALIAKERDALRFGRACEAAR